MSGYIEVQVKGNRRAYIEAGSIAGIITSPGLGLADVGHIGAPVSVILRAGETIEVIGMSAGLLLVKAKMVRKRVRDEGADILIEYLEAVDEAPVEE